jgi:hypothetical protein
MASPSNHSLRAIADSLRGRGRCRRMQGLLADPVLASADAKRDLAELVRGISGRELSSDVLSRDPSRVSLTELFDEGGSRAEAVIAQTGPGEAILEYAGGIGQVAHAVAPGVKRLVSVDPDPRAAAFGTALVAGVAFSPLDELPAGETFDGAYAIGVFDRLEPTEWEAALEFLRSHLAPGAWLLLDPPAPGPEFRALYEPYFQARSALARSGSLVLERRSAQAPPAPATAGDRWAVAEASVVADVLDDEVVVVDLDNGAYYILEGSASVIWQMLAAGQELVAVTAMLSQWHPTHAEGMATAVSDFTAQLAGEGLLVPAPEGGGPALPELDLDALRGEAPFKPPEMFRYTEMEALIQMDPIREYDESGWPRRPAARSRRM